MYCMERSRIQRLCLNVGFFALEPRERSVSGGYFSRIAAKPFLGSGILCRLLFIVEPIVPSVPFCSQVYSPRLHP